MNAIISASELASDLVGPNPPVVLDIRWQLSTATAAGAAPFDGRAAYAAGHIPGAVFVDLDAELAGEPGEGGRHPLPDLEAFGEAMRAAGVSADRDVVVYDGGVGWAAARPGGCWAGRGIRRCGCLTAGWPSGAGRCPRRSPSPPRNLRAGRGRPAAAGRGRGRRARPYGAVARRPGR